MTRFREKLERLNRFGLLIPGIALGIFVYYNLAYVFFSVTNAAVSRDLPRAFYFTKLVSQPEPYETLGYFLGFLIIPLFAIIFARLGNFLVEREIISRRFVSLWPVALFVAVLAFLACKVSLHLFWFDLWKEIKPRGDLKLQLLLGLSLVIGLVAYWRKINLVRFEHKFAAWSPKLRVIFLSLIIFLIFSPNFPFDMHHYNDLIAPAHDMLFGKYLLVDTMTPYGFLNTYFYYWLFKFAPFSYQVASLALFVVYAIWNVSWYYFIKRWLRSEFLAVIGIFASVIFLTSPDLILGSYSAPSSMPFHQIGFLLLAWLWLRYAEDPQDRRRENWLILGTAIAFYWFVDTGIYGLLATLGTFLFVGLLRSDSWFLKVRAFLWQATRIILWILLIAGTYSLWVYEQTRLWPNWRKLFDSIFAYSRGYMLFPLPSHGIYYIFVFVFLLTLLYIIRQAVTRGERDKLIIPLFITLFGVLQFNYYITRSHSLNVAPRHVIFLVLLILWWYILIRDRYESAEFARAWHGVLVGVLVFMGICGAYKIGYTLKTNDYQAVARNFTQERIGRPEIYGGNADILEDIVVLKNDYALLRRPAVVHWYDAKIMFELGKTNYFPIYHLLPILYKSEMDSIIKIAREEKPQYIFFGRKDTPGMTGFTDYADKLDYFYDGVQDLYTVDRQLKTLDVLKLQ